MKRLLLTSLLLTVCLSNSLLLMSQSLTLTFTGKSFESDYIPLDSVTIFNWDANWQETIYFTDTVFVMNQGVGITTHDQHPSAQLKVSPNPTNGNAVAQLWLPKSGNTTLTLADLSGKVLHKWSGHIEKGCHIFNISLSNTQVCLLTAKTSQAAVTEKIINTGDAGHTAIHYSGMISKEDGKKQGKGQSSHSFSYYDCFICTGYVTVNGKVYQKSLDYLALEDKFLPFYFDVITSYGNNPCPGTATVSDFDGNEYPTVQIGSQCWLQKNLRTTHYDNGDEIPFSTDVSCTQAYRHYPGLDSNHVDLYGYLYNWMAVIHSDTSAVVYTPFSSDTSGRRVQGICPKGWHVPTYDEFQVLKQFLSQDSLYYCGDDSTHVAKAISARMLIYNTENSSNPCAPEWYSYTNNASGFTGLMAGRYVGPTCSFFGGEGAWWTCTWKTPQGAAALGIHKTLPFLSPTQALGTNFSEGHAVRCIKDENTER